MTGVPFEGILPNSKRAEIDVEKFFHYSMDPSNIGNQNKWMAFQKIGYQVHSAEWKIYRFIPQYKHGLILKATFRTE